MYNIVTIAVLNTFSDILHFPRFPESFHYLVNIFLLFRVYALGLGERLLEMK